MPDNFRIDVVSVGKEQLRRCVALAMEQRKKCVAWAVEEAKVGNSNANRNESTLVLLWTDNLDGALPLPLPASLDVDGATDMAWRWLQEVKIKARRPDIDGDSDVGFHAFNEAWTHVLGYSGGIIGIQPAWLMYGK